MHNPSLKKLIIRGELSLLVQFLPHLFEIVASVPHLEELEFYIDPWDEKHHSSLVGFQFLDEWIQSYPSLQRVDFMRRRVSGGWYEFQRNLRNDMPRCVTKRMISFTERIPFY